MRSGTLLKMCSSICSGCGKCLFLTGLLCHIYVPEGNCWVRVQIFECTKTSSQHVCLCLVKSVRCHSLDSQILPQPGWGLILTLVTCDFPPPTIAAGKLCSHNIDNNTMNNIIMSGGLDKMHCTNILMIKCGNSSLLMFSVPWASSLHTKFRSGWSQMKNRCLEGISCC